jgi:hypothetical protein
MDDRTDGQRTDDETDDGMHGFKGGFILHFMHNAQVCYFNNVWFMFLIFKKNFYFFKQPLVPPSSPRSFTFPTPVLYPVYPPPSVLHISHSGSLTHRAPHPVLPILHISHSGLLPRRPPTLFFACPCSFSTLAWHGVGVPVTPYRHSGRVTLPQVGSKWVHWLPMLHVTNGESTRSTLRYCP